MGNNPSQAICVNMVLATIKFLAQKTKVIAIVTALCLGF